MAFNNINHLGKLHDFILPLINPVVVCSLNYEQTTSVDHEPTIVRLKDVNINGFEISVASTCKYPQSIELNFQRHLL